MKQLLIWLIRLYQKYLSRLKGQPTCRFYPTCSAYAIEALQKRGFFAGTLLALWRIFRCQPFGKAGYDPVPEKGIFRPRYVPHPMTKYFYPEDYDLEAVEDPNTQ